MPASDGGDAPRQPRAPGVVRCCVEPSGPRIQMVSCTSILLRSAPTAPPFCQAPTADADLRVFVSSYSRRHWTSIHGPRPEIGGVSVTDHFAADAILRDIATFTELGDHRTGWPADNAVSDWLVAELRAAGVAAEHAPFSFPFVRPEPSWIDVDGKRVEGAPLYDGGTTGPAGAGAPLTDDPARANGAILVLRN